MKTRTRKVLSLLLAAAMVFTMNTVSFAEEVPVDLESEAVEVVEASEREGSAVETEEAVGFDAEEAGETEPDAMLDDAETFDLAEGDRIIQGVTYGKDRKPKTRVTFTSDGDKKNPRDNIVTITNTDDPISWNNFYAAQNLETILTGESVKDEWFNNSTSSTASKNGAYRYGRYEPVEGLKSASGEKKLKVMKLGTGNAYLIIGYGIRNSAGSYDSWEHIQGYDDPEPTYYGSTYPDRIPFNVWDGRITEFNKSGLNKFDKSKKEAIDVEVAIVTYSNGTVQELKGVTLGKVTVDKKNQKKPSVAWDNEVVSANIKRYDYARNTVSEVQIAIPESKKLCDLPFFKIKVNVKDEAKKYRKDLNTLLKNEKFYFGVMQRPVDFSAGNMPDTEADDVFNTMLGLVKVDRVAKDRNYSYTVSEGRVKKNEERLSKWIAANGKDGVYVDTDLEEFIFDGGSMKISNFNPKKKTAAITLRVMTGDRNKGYDTLEDGKKLSKKEFSLDEEGKIAGQTVYVLNFKGDTYIYSTGIWLISRTGPEYYEDQSTRLGDAGFRYAFRVSDEKKKKFRAGIYKENNNGFVFGE